MLWCILVVLCFFKQKTAYEVRISDWRSDVCSSDLSDYRQERGYRSDPRTCALISEYLGNNLQKIAGELDKLLLNFPAGTSIGVDEVEKNIGISKDFNVFELTAALGKKDKLKAHRIVNYFASNPKDHPHVVVMGALAGFFSKLVEHGRGAGR